MRAGPHPSTSGRWRSSICVAGIAAFDQHEDKADFIIDPVGVILSYAA